MYDCKIVKILFSFTVVVRRELNKVQEKDVCKRKDNLIRIYLNHFFEVFCKFNFGK